MPSPRVSLAGMTPNQLVHCSLTARHKDCVVAGWHQLTRDVGASVHSGCGHGAACALAMLGAPWCDRPSAGCNIGSGLLLALPSSN